MITLITGLNGAGKGVYGLDWLKHKAEKEGRTVYYNGIRECKIPGWILLEDPTKWFEIPPGSYFIQDESQEHYRPRANGSVVPDHIQKLERHREAYSLDLVYMTPHPMLLDANLRRLVGQHFHLVRKFGMEKAVVHEWNQLKESPDKNRNGSIRHDYTYNKEVYNWYKSSTVHTYKKNLPMSYYIMFAVPFVVAALGYFLYSQIADDGLVGTFQAPALQQSQSELIQRAPQVPVYDFFEARQERVAGLPHTAPAYDEVTKPVEAPIPAACVDFKGECKCYTQQGTRMQTPPDMCRQIVERGFFVDFENGDALQTKQRQTEPQRPPLERVASVAPERGEKVAPASVDGPMESGERSPSKITRERMAASQWAFKEPTRAVQ